MKTLFAIAAVAVALAAQPAAAVEGLGHNTLALNGIAWDGTQASAPANDPRADSIGSSEMIAVIAIISGTHSGQGSNGQGSNGQGGKGQGGNSQGSNDRTDSDAFAGQPPPGDLAGQPPPGDRS
jgi:hypothetical protein